MQAGKKFAVLHCQTTCQGLRCLPCLELSLQAYTPEHQDQAADVHSTCTCSHACVFLTAGASCGRQAGSWCLAAAPVTTGTTHDSHQQAEHVQEMSWLPMRRTTQLEGTDSGLGPQPGCRLPCVLRSDACSLPRRLASSTQHSPGSCAACFPWLRWLLATASSTDPSVAAPASIAHRSCCS